MLVIVAGSARADLTGSYAGQLSVKRDGTTTDAAAVLTEATGTLTGTVVLDTSAPALAGAYVVTGKHRGKRVRLRGLTPGGAKLAFRGVSGSDTLAGKVRVRLGDAHAKARLTLTKLPGGADGSSCSAVFVDNQEFFTTEVMDGVLLPVCAACHVAGGQAAATRLRVVAGDPAATAHSTFAVIDPAAPGDSLLLSKPLARLPHGGGQQITEGSNEAQALAVWADLVAQADCSGPPVPATGPELYAAHCAGCHGADAAGLDGRPDVRCTVPSRITDAVRAGRGPTETGMPAFTTAQLTNDQMALVVEFLVGLCSGQPADVYASNCATCHGATASGGRNADGVRGPGIRCTEGGDVAEALSEGEERMPAFPSLIGSAGELAQFINGFCTEE
jgi:mono/diheme cytochrome c family protein